MHAASREGIADVVNVLIEAGANLNLQANVSSLTCTYIYYWNTFIYILINNIYNAYTTITIILI